VLRTIFQLVERLTSRHTRCSRLNTEYPSYSGCTGKVFEGMCENEPAKPSATSIGFPVGTKSGSPFIGRKENPEMDGINLAEAENNVWQENLRRVS